MNHDNYPAQESFWVTMKVSLWVDDGRNNFLIDSPVRVLLEFDGDHDQPDIKECYLDGELVEPEKNLEIEILNNWSDYV